MGSGRSKQYQATAAAAAQSSTSMADAKSMIAEFSKGLPMTRDLTDAKETMRVLEIASEIIKSGHPIQQFKDACFGDAEGKNAGPSVVVSAVGSAESKMKMKACGPFHMICIYAMYGEQNRIQTKEGHKNGQDFIRMKAKQLEWLFEGETEKTWEIYAVDDGCPNDSKSLARAIIEKDGLKNITVLDLEDAVKEGIAYFTDRGLKAGCKESRKGGAILYGLYTASKKQDEKVPQLVMYTDSDLSTDMSLCGLLASGILDGHDMSMGARYGMPETFLVKPPDYGASGHPLSHFEQPNMMKIAFRHYTRKRLLPMLASIYDTQCAFKCFHTKDVMPIIEQVKSMGADFDMELLLCALTYYKTQGREKMCHVSPTLFTEDFAESNFMASSEDPDKPFKTYAAMTTGLADMHERYIPAESPEAEAAKDFKEFCRGLTWEMYKNMIVKLEKDLGPTLFDYDFTLDQLKAATAA